MPPVLMRASYGGIPFWMATMSGRAGRDVTVKSPSRGDVHVLQDRGLRHRTLQCELMFVDEPGLDRPEERWLAFRAMAEKPEGQLLTHPLDGSYLARVADLDYRVDAGGGEISVSCMFLYDGEPQTVIEPGLGSAPYAGLEEVSATAYDLMELMEVMDASPPDGLDSALLPADDVPLTSATPQRAIDTVTAWTQADTPDTRAVYLQAASLSNEINDEINRLELITNLDRWPIYREFIELNFQVRRAAEAVTTEADDVFDVAVASAIPLRLLCTQLYGAVFAEEKARQATQINRLRTPGLVPAGTVLKMPREGAR